DAWFGETVASTVGAEVERSLSPQRWHYRLPFFAKELSPNRVQVRSNTQAVMDREIQYARTAGIDYWAFVMYAEDAPMTAAGLNLYLASRRKPEIHFCMIVERLDDATIDRLIRYFQDQSYQTVVGGRPLVYMIGPQRLDDPAWPHARPAIARLRDR